MNPPERLSRGGKPETCEKCKTETTDLAHIAKHVICLNCWQAWRPVRDMIVLTALEEWIGAPPA